jgi:HSP20 family protein
MASRFFAPAITFGQPGGRVANPDPFRLLQRGMDTFLTDLVRTAGSVQGGTDDLLPSPRIDVEETDNEIRVTAELPGLSERDVQITLDDDVLMISGEKCAEEDRDQGNMRIVERVFGQFRRALQLPFAPDPERVEARYSDGILTVTIPKDGEQRSRTRRIEVQREAGDGASRARGSEAAAPGGEGMAGATGSGATGGGANAGATGSASTETAEAAAS